MLTAARGRRTRLRGDVPALPRRYPPRRSLPAPRSSSAARPIRDERNQDGLWAGLQAGAIDCVVSDHSPCTADLKCLDSGDFGDAWGGIASLQLGLPLMWTQARQRGIALSEVVRWMSSAPARIAG